MKKLNKAAVFMTALILAAVCACAVSAGTPLPGWRYTGSDPIEAAAAEYAAGFQSDYRVSDVSVCVPAPVILRTEKTDDDHCLVYGNFWIFNYELNGDVMECISGGEAPGVIALAQNGGEWTVTDFDRVGDGDDYSRDIIRVSGDDETLKQAFYESGNGGGDLLTGVRERFLRDYVTSNGLGITAYRDYGRDAVPLFGEACDEDVLSLLR